jgi:hypothetical protein
VSIETAVRARILEPTAVRNFVGTRVSSEWRREGTELPAVVYSVESRTPVQTLTGISTLAEFMVAVDCIASTMATARDLAKAVSDIMNTNTGYTLNENTLIRWSATEDEDVERMDDQEGTDDGPRVVRQTYRIWATGG